VNKKDLWINGLKSNADILYIYKMRIFRRLCWIVLLVIPLAATGQYTKEFKRIFFDAEYLYQTGFYEEAFSRYKNLLTLDPGNSNILFHCGACCLEIPGNEQQAVAYLQEAASGVTLSYNERSHSEPGAPVLSYFMLGRAYHLNNNFEKAIENYELYRKAAADEDPLQVEFAGIQIEACRRAEQVGVERPSFEFQSVLDQCDDDLPSCNYPVVSGDGNILIFLVDYPNDKKIMMTRRKGDTWSRPRVINSEIGMVGETYPVCLSYDGLDLYVVHQFYSHSAIFASRFQGGRWSEAEALGSNVNGRTSEIHASVSKDGNTLYYVSDARGGMGSFDIYVSSLEEKGKWGVPSNLGPMINTPYEEHSPFISSNDSILFFSSQGHSSIGGIDVFYSELGADGQWMEPLSLGYPVNTTGDDVFFNPGWDELDGYYAVRRVDDPTSNTINMVIELDPPVAEELAEAKPLSELSDTVIQMTAAMQQPVEISSIADGTSTSVPVSSIELLGEAENREANYSVEKAIEPEETDEILEVLNRGEGEARAGSPDPTPSSPVAGARVLQTSVPFDHNASELTMAAMLEVEKVADVMQKYPDTKIRLTGHADATGSSDYNLLLSSQRAEQIAGYLEMRGVERSRVTLEGKGEHAPVARNYYADGSDAPLGRYLNRQVSITLESPEPIRAELAGFYVPAALKAEAGEQEAGSSDYWFTIQVLAKTTSINFEELVGLDMLREYSCKDNIFRYTCGEYRSFEEARSSLERIKKTGYPDAFIQTLEWYSRAAR